MGQSRLTKEGLPVVSLETIKSLGQDIFETDSSVTALEIANENINIVNVIEGFSRQFPSKETRCQAAVYMMAIYQLLKKQAESNILNQTLTSEVKP